MSAAVGGSGLDLPWAQAHRPLVLTGCLLLLGLAWLLAHRGWRIYQLRSHLVALVVGALLGWVIAWLVGHKVLWLGQGVPGLMARSLLALAGAAAGWSWAHFNVTRVARTGVVWGVLRPQSIYAIITSHVVAAIVLGTAGLLLAVATCIPLGFTSALVVLAVAFVLCFLLGVRGFVQQLEDWRKQSRS